MTNLKEASDVTSLRWLGFLGLLFLVPLLVAGCSGTSGGPVGGVEPKITEYVGAGGGDAKPLPDFLGIDNAQTRAIATLLGIDQSPIAQTTNKKHVNWNRLPALTYGMTLLVCVQPTADEDSDLYILDGSGSYGSGAALIGSSTRTPTSSFGGAIGGYVPDWVAFDVGPTAGKPAAYADVYGYPSGLSKKHYRIEAHEALIVTVNGGIPNGVISQYQSHWWYFDALSGTHYTVHLTASAGDPDVYVYENTSVEFVGSASTSGGGNVALTAAETGRHYVRIYGFGAGSNGYALSVSSP